MPAHKEKLFEAKNQSGDKYTIWKSPEQKTFFFRAAMAVDADGSPKAYHPENKGLDDLEHAGEPGNWWAIETHNGKPNGKPVIQGDDDPAPGYYISMTALYDPDINRPNPRRYVDATKIPYIVLPENNDREFLKKADVEEGDFAAVYNAKNGKLSFAIFADTGLFFAGNVKEYRFGEGSIALAEALDIPSNPRNGGTTKKDLLYIVFPGSGNRKPRSITDINNKAKKLFEEWGGIKHAKDLFDEV